MNIRSIVLPVVFLLGIMNCSLGYVNLGSTFEDAWGIPGDAGSGGFSAVGNFVVDGGTGKTKHGTCGDEYGLVAIVAEQIVENGGYFCPKHLQCTNKKKKKWSDLHMYTPSGGGAEKCVWLCGKGHSGANCVKRDVPLPGMDLPTNTSSGGVFSGVSMLQSGCWADGGVKDASSGINVFHHWTANGDEDHAVVLGVIEFKEHGVKAAPIRVRCESENTKNNDSWIADLYTYNVAKTKLLCAEGYMPNADETDCIRHTELNTEIVEKKKSFCSGWDELKYDSTIHNIDLSDTCIKFFCKDSLKAFPAAGDYSCVECADSIRGGQDTGTGLCVKCDQVGQYFNKKTSKCESAAAYSKVDLQYGKGMSKGSDLTKQCWTITTPDEYAKCVREGEDYTPSGGDE